MTVPLARLLILIYGLSIAGYVLLDSTHEILHAFKSKTHQHSNYHTHTHFKTHHVEDHQVFSQDHLTKQESSISVKIFGFHLFFQAPPIAISVTPANRFINNGLFDKVRTVPHTPLIPPPLR
ncbi:MAG: hypothetical protein J0L67_03635 [Cytophagales bacterium]|nr:hypothetical protein [Cytophagales bacterium]